MKFLGVLPKHKEIKEGFDFGKIEVYDPHHVGLWGLDRGGFAISSFLKGSR